MNIGGGFIKKYYEKYHHYPAFDIKHIKKILKGKNVPDIIQRFREFYAPYSSMPGRIKVELKGNVEWRHGAYIVNGIPPKDAFTTIGDVEKKLAKKLGYDGTDKMRFAFSQNMNQNLGLLGLAGQSPSGKKEIVDGYWRWILKHFRGFFNKQKELS